MGDTGGAGDTKGSNKARRSPTVTGQRQEAHYDDEHPEIPKVRRASLYLNAAPVQAHLAEQIKGSQAESLEDDDWEQETRLASPAGRTRTERLPEDDWEQDPHPTTAHTRRIHPQRLPEDDWEQEIRYEELPTRRPQTLRTPHAPQEDYAEQEPRRTTPTRRARLQQPQKDYNDYAEQETRLNRPRPATNNKFAPTQRPAQRPAQHTAQRHHPIAYEPQPAAYHKIKERPLRRQQRPQQALWAHIQDLRHNHTMLFIVGILIALVIIVPFLINLTQTSIATIQTIGGDVNASLGAQNANGPGIGRDTEHPAPPVYATAAYLLDADTGATLYEHNASLHLPMMSTTKLMTGLLATQHGNLDQKITINDAIANDINQLSADSSVMGVKKGETYTLRELLYGLMLPSGNDAALAIADTISGSPQKFVDLMNQRAQELGLHDTHYRNPHGLMDDGHYASAHDLAVLGKVIMDVPSLRQITGSREYHIAGNNEHAEHFLSNSNQFMWWYPGVDGGKIGWDAGANFVQVISCTRNKHHLIGVTLHTIDWWTDMRDLMNWGFHSFTWLSPREINANEHPIPFAADWNYFARDKRENSISLGNQGRYYIFTGYSVTQPVAGFFDKNGGLAKLGFPISQPQTVDSSLRQRFEHGTVQCDQGSKQCKIV
ncbi:MAG: hypothetical protein NVSMB44_26710 [Ktedonobacteraceae bacterium]